MTTHTQADLLHESDRLYLRYVKPLEREHLGEYAAVSVGGQVLLAPTLLDLIEKAERMLPPGNFLFKVGDIAVDTWR
jgi:hypothetical protein